MHCLAVPREGCVTANVQTGVVVSLETCACLYYILPSLATFSLAFAVRIVLLAQFLLTFTVPLCIFSLFFAGQGEKGDTGIKVGMRNVVFYCDRYLGDAAPWADGL